MVKKILMGTLSLVLSLTSLALVPSGTVLADPVLPKDTIITYTSSGSSASIRSVKSDGTGDTALITSSSVAGVSNPMLNADRTKIYFLGNSNYNRDVYRANVDGSSITSLGYTVPNTLSHGALSPDGTKLAYLNGTWWDGAETRPAITIRNVDGSGTPSSIHPSVGGNPDGIAWATNSKLVFRYDENSNGGSNTCNLSMAALNTDGTGFTRLLDNRSQTANSCGTPRWPNVNPVTGAIVYTVTFTSSNYLQKLYIMNSDGSNNRVLYTPPSYTTGGGTTYYGTADEARWSPDGNSIAFSYSDPTPYTGGNGIGNLNAVAGTLIRYFNVGAGAIVWASQYTPTTLANDRIVTYTSNGSTSSIRSVKSDGTSDTTLIASSTVAKLSNPMLASDRTKIYFLGNNSYNRDVYVANSDGAGIVKLSYTVPNTLSAAALSPDGTKLAYANGTWWDGTETRPAITIRNVDGSGTPGSIHAAAGGSPSEYAWISNTKLVFRFDENTSNNCYSWIASMNTDGSSFSKLTPDNTAQPSNSCALPRWPRVNSTNGDIAYSAYTTAGLQKIYKMSSTGTGHTVLYTPPSYTTGGGTTYYGGADSPLWSPDGSEIVFGYYDPTPYTGGNGIGILNVNTGTLTRYFNVGAGAVHW